MLGGTRAPTDEQGGTLLIGSRCVGEAMDEEMAEVRVVEAPSQERSQICFRWTEEPCGKCVEGWFDEVFDVEGLVAM